MLIFCNFIENNLDKFSNGDLDRLVNQIAEDYLDEQITLPHYFNELLKLRDIIINYLYNRRGNKYQ
jgi:hypothetical protein